MLRKGLLGVFSLDMLNTPNAYFTGSMVLSVLHDEEDWPGQDIDVFCDCPFVEKT